MLQRIDIKLEDYWFGYNEYYVYYDDEHMTQKQVEKALDRGNILFVLHVQKQLAIVGRDAMNDRGSQAVFGERLADGGYIVSRKHAEKAGALLPFLGFVAMDTVGLYKDQISPGNGVRLPVDLDGHIPFQHQHHFITAVHVQGEGVVNVFFK